MKKESKKSKPAPYMKCRGLYVFLENSKLDFGSVPKLAFLRQAQTWVLSQGTRSKSSLRIVTQKSIRPDFCIQKIDKQLIIKKIPNFG